MELHDGMLARLPHDGESALPFPMTNDVKQACVMVPTLFSMMFSVILTDVFHDSDIRISLRF